ncbi:MAG: DNA translocase FtsK 4TM domain-containing protein [Patescibacteria group bacterium]
MAKKKKDNSYDYLSVPSLNLDDKAKRSIGIVAVFAFGLISLLGLFNLSGAIGGFLSKWLMLIFGFGKWLVPLVFLFWGLLLVQNKKYEIKASDYIGLFFLFVSYQTLFHFFLAESEWKTSVIEGIGGGYIGLWLSQLFNYAFGFWGGVIILLCLFLVSLVIVFNTSLSKLIGRESVWATIFRPVGKLFSLAFSSTEEEKPNRRKTREFIESAREDILGSWKAKEVADLLEEEEEEEEDEPAHQGPTAAVLKQDMPKQQEKINWPKKQIKIDVPLELLNHKIGQAIGGDTNANASKIKKTLENFGIPVEMADTKVGPTVTQYTFKPAEGVKLSKITTLSNDLSLSLAAHPIRIEAPIPGQSLVGIEVPNKTKAVVGLREILEDGVFKNRKHNLMIALGKDVAGTSWIYDITRMPHLLVAGATNSGKSVCLNTIIISLLYQNNPDDLRFIMVDPKRVELPVYNGIPHLLVPVITDVAKTINALKWCLNEMNSRYDILNKSGKKNIQSYNTDNPKEKMPYIIFIIDELADFMMTAGKEMEAAIIRLAQMSRAVGIHLILATQRPSVDVITGLIKANIPARIAFSVTSMVDSKTILDMSGAEKLLGQGDMLLSTSELSKPKRIQGAYVSDEEINDVINYIKEKSGEPEYLDGVTDRQKVGGVAGVGMDGNYGDEDELMEQAKEIIINADRASTSLLQRRLSIGYGRAAKILDMLEENGFIGPSNGSKPREVLVSKEQYENGGAISAMPVHSRGASSAPAAYLPDEGNDDTLDFSADEETEEEEEEETPDFLENDGPEDIVKDEEEILEEISEDIEEDGKEEDNEEEDKSEDAPKEKMATKPRPLDDDDDTFFAR